MNPTRTLAPATPQTGSTARQRPKLTGDGTPMTASDKAKAKAGFKRWQASGQKPAQRPGSRVVRRKLEDKLR